jgi:carbon monoxide dehydrogenase subunit G
MKTQLAVSVGIKAAPAVVFEYLTDLKRHPLWNPHLRSISMDSRLRLGSSYQTTSQFLGRTVKGNNTITRLVPEQELEIQNSSGMLRYIVSYQLEEEGSETRLICSVDVEADSMVFAFAVPVLETLARRELQADIQMLKIAAEEHLE